MEESSCLYRSAKGAFISTFSGAAQQIGCTYIAGDWIKSNIKFGHFQGSGNEIRGFGQ
jgi:hypothetical protein